MPAFPPPRSEPAFRPQRPIPGLAALAAALLAAACALAPAARAAPPAGAAGEATPEVGTGIGRDASARVRDAMVRVDAHAIAGAASSDTLGPRRVGSGVIIAPQLVLTIGYLLLETEDVDVTTASGRRIPATVAGYDHASGFGLLRSALPLDGKVLALGDSDRVSESQVLLTIGHGEPELTRLLVVSRKPFVGSWEYLLERPIYTYPPVNNWSGSALVDEGGRLVGIGSLIVGDAAADRRGVPGNLFVPVSLLKPILADLVASGRRQGPAQPWLGLGTETVRGRLMVARVSRDGPAAEAGLAPGDIVLGVGGEAVSDQADFYRRLWRLGPAGTEVTLRVLRGGTVQEIRLRSVDRMETLARPSGV
ncbi:MAG TPA: S1C family serine protease [Quisquiliibacterium sp.]|nr:S1C family serine protease [Quisquiliibacterium sp.]